MFGGGSGPAEQQQADASFASQGQDNASNSSTWGPRSCENDAKTFTKCLDENQGNMQICGWYLDQLVSKCLSSVVLVFQKLKTDTESLSDGRQSVLEIDPDTAIVLLLGSKYV